MAALTPETVEKFMHTQVACWNAGDREGFFNAYRSIAPNGLHIEYVGAHSGDGMQILAGMWEQQRSAIDIEEVALIVIGDEAVAHNRNKVKGSDLVIETIEQYHFADNGTVSVRYFIKKPQG